MWIEIDKMRAAIDKWKVTPFAGVWIEIRCPLFKLLVKSGHSLRGSVD